MKIIPFIKTIDFLGETMNFSINKSRNFQTVLGGILSIIIYVAYIYFFYFFGFDFFFKQNPNSISQLKSPSDKEISLLNISNLNFFIGARLEDMYGNNINLNDLLFVQGRYEDYNYNVTTNNFTEKFDYLEVVSCDKINKTNLNFEPIEMNSFLCFDLKKLKNFPLVDFKDKQQNFRLSFNFCKNDNLKECKDISKFLEIMEEKNSLLLTILYPQISYDPDNYKNPLSFDLNFNLIYIDSFISGSTQISFHKTLLEDDRGGLFESKETIEMFGVKNIQNFVNVRNKKLSKDYLNDWKKFTSMDNRLHDITVFYDKIFMLHTRKYMKFQDLLANVNGFMDLILFIIGILYKFYNQFRINVFLFNKLVFIYDETFSNKQRILRENPIKDIKGLNDIKIENHELKKINSINKVELINIKERINIPLKEIKREIKFYKNKSEIGEFISNRQIADNTNKENQSFECNEENFFLLRDDLINICFDFIKPKNRAKFKYYNYLRKNICLRKFEHFNFYNVLSDYVDKFYKKFEITYYFEKLREIKLIKKLLLKESTNNFLKIFSKKNCLIKSNFESENIIRKVKNKEEDIINNLINGEIQDFKQEVKMVYEMLMKK